MTLKELFRIELEMKEKEDKKIDEFFNLCKKHLVHARTKHPQFAKRILTRSTELANEYLAGFHKKMITQDDFYALEDILMSELHEFLVEAHRGNRERAIEEACDIFAVLFRYIAGDMDNENNNR